MSLGKGDSPGASRAISSGRSAPWAASLAVLPKRIPEACELRWVRYGSLKIVPVSELEQWLEKSASHVLGDET